jgi:hypothetical protein
MKPSELKTRIMEIYSDSKSYGMLEALQKEHALDCLLAVYLKTNTPQTDKHLWGFTKELIEEIRGKTPKSFTISDGTFRKRMEYLENTGLVKSKKIDPLKKDYETTTAGNILSEAWINLMHSKTLLGQLYGIDHTTR